MNTQLLIVGKTNLNRVFTAKAKTPIEFAGGSGYFAALSASFTRSATLLTKVGADFPAIFLDELSRRQISTSFIERLPTPGIVWEATYENAQTHRTLAWRNTEITDDNLLEIPAQLRNCQFVYLGEMLPALQLRLIAQLSGRILLDTKRPWVRNHTADLRSAISQVTMVVMNQEEASTLIGHDVSPEGLALGLRALGPAQAIVNLGAAGSILSSGNHLIKLIAPLNQQPEETTGAGDTFSGAFLSALAAGFEPARAFLHGQVMASFVTEAHGAQRLLTLDQGEIEQRTAQAKADHLLQIIAGEGSL